ncbi:hypothetical protein BD289DRAFT_409845 [Coniella lustricola]|uniref:Uncharacterized protein n=1 Tax=Coniella lustricola TaxID=2025994 RepID=A0A2T3A772_9PEZI|nr:hypothetical protein BD289DRAFT_409845 [Coniella lustricola]
MTLSSAIENLFKSVYELFASVIGAIASVINTIITAILNFFSGVINLFADVFKGAIDVVGGVGSFILSNIVVIGVIAAGYVIYTRQQQGKPVVPTKKTN